VSIKLLRRPRGRKHDEGSRIAHIRDWEAYGATGQIKALCGKKLKGMPAVGYRECCVVCLSLVENRRWGVR
jgi:hypothetical protein